MTTNEGFVTVTGIGPELIQVTDEEGRTTLVHKSLFPNTPKMGNEYWMVTVGTKVQSIEV